MNYLCLACNGNNLETVMKLPQYGRKFEPQEKISRMFFFLTQRKSLSKKEKVKRNSLFLIFFLTLEAVIHQERTAKGLQCCGE